MHDMKVEMKTEVKVELYTTLGCHLCDEALAMLKFLQASEKSLTLAEIEIADSEELMSEYGVRIPVITAEKSEGDISWPFTIEELTQFLNLD
jgi:glutaredoxin